MSKSFTFVFDSDHNLIRLVDKIGGGRKDSSGSEKAKESTYYPQFEVQIEICTRKLNKLKNPNVSTGTHNSPIYDKYQTQ